MIAHITRLATPLVLLVTLQNIAHAELNTAGFAEELRQAILPEIERQNLPGLAVGVVANDKLIYAEGFGVQKLGESTPVTSETLFHMASVTKPFVATAIFQLAEQGKLNLDDRVTDHLDYFEIRGEGAVRTMMLAAVLLEDQPDGPGLGVHDPEPVGLDDPVPVIAHGAVAEGVGAVVAAALVLRPGDRHHALGVDVSLELRRGTELAEHELADRIIER